MQRQIATGLLVTGFMVLGCAKNFPSMVTQRAASDFQCSEAEIQVEEKRVEALGGDFVATGCGKSDSYYTECSLFGVCKTLSSGELAERDAAIEARNAAYYENAQSAPPPSESSPSESSPSSSSPPPSSSSSSLPSNCSFASDCGPGVKCNSGRCANTEGSSCGFDSDCGGNGTKCNSGKCSNAPDGKCSFDSECPGGKCSSGTCKF